ncbi:hypothetical protein DRN82_05310 [Thermococci archaeon]|nr:MAG: hypothetical protein DRN82_05310 [Thermococci archaeon]
MRVKVFILIFVVISIVILGGIAIINAMEVRYEYNLGQESYTPVLFQKPQNRTYIWIVAEEPLKTRLEDLMKEKFPDAEFLENATSKVNGSIIIAYLPRVEANFTLLKKIVRVDGVIYYSANGNAKPMIKFMREYKKNVCKNMIKVKEYYEKELPESGTLHLVCLDLTIRVGKLANVDPLDKVTERIRADLKDFP